MNITLYHGSKKIIEKPIYGLGNKRNDYGLGFYCTQDLVLAKEWAVDERSDGYANKYELNMDNLSCLDLSSKEYNILHWIAILLENRIFDLKYTVSKTGKDYLIENFSLPYNDYDLIKGYRADDSYFSFADAFLKNNISCQRLSEALRLGNLGKQIVIKSQKAFNSLKFIGIEVASSDICYPIRKERNEKARIAFLSGKEGDFNDDALYLIDIIRNGVDKNDPRLQ